MSIEVLYVHRYHLLVLSNRTSYYAVVKAYDSHGTISIQIVVTLHQKEGERIDVDTRLARISDEEDLSPLASHPLPLLRTYQDCTDPPPVLAQI